MTKQPITASEALEYEVYSSWWIPFMLIKPLQDFGVWYYTQKVTRRYKRYMRARALQEEVENSKGNF